MAITKQKKVEILKTLKKVVDDSESLVFVNFHGLPVASETDVRTTLRSNDVGYFVAKKTLVKRTLTEKGITGEMPELEGEVAVVYGSDLIAPAREVNEFTKKYKENLSILGGVFEGRFMNREEMVSIAEIPPLEVLYGQVVNLINSPIQSFVMALGQIADKKEA